jgi:hypothetical protein
MKQIVRDELGGMIELEVELADAVIIRGGGGTAVALFDRESGELELVERLAPDAALPITAAVLVENLARAYRTFEANR